MLVLLVEVRKEERRFYIRRRRAWTSMRASSEAVDGSRHRHTCCTTGFYGCGEPWTWLARSEPQRGCTLAALEQNSVARLAPRPKVREWVGRCPGRS